MRNYSIISPAFWTGKTGKAIKAKGAETQMLALYLMSSPHSNMIGLYFLPKLYISYETGLSEEGASKGLQDLLSVGFCDYDDQAEVVWVYEMARFQIGEFLTATDNRVKSVKKEFDNTPKCKFLIDFAQKYGEAFHLGKIKKAPSKGLLTEQTSTDHDQEQDQTSFVEQTEAPFVTLTLNDKSEYPIFETQIAEWQALFPAVDIRQELRAMRAWCTSNPKQRKTRTGILRFVTSWLSKSQNRGGANAKTGKSGEHLTALQRVEKAHAERQQ